MAKYHVKVWLEAGYDDIEADSEEEAFVIASDCAMEGGNWGYDAELIEEDEEKDDDEVQG